MIVVARQRDASRAIAGFPMREFDGRAGVSDVGASLREMLVIGGEIFERHRASHQRRFERPGNVNRGGN